MPAASFDGYHEHPARKRLQCLSASVLRQPLLCHDAFALSTAVALPAPLIFAARCHPCIPPPVMLHFCTMVRKDLILNALWSLIVTTAALEGLAAPPAAGTETASPQEQKAALYKIEFEPDAYYTSLGLYLALTEAPIPHVGEQSEKDLYLTLLSRA